ncbi:phosphoribosylaminoimidazole carboxylase ade2 [Brettanomyces bruxellensis]|uniref:Phosphoribosylaminoimidazole carboxylase n=1 Tax=Dekkera bruxellensis TaxID=5007 RepID=A0A8H6BLU7_DEKBR|nr:phosphoribosylaminoimidazole carboxylase ade2 [Brettanomyces bruxellensis]KAF6013739.1 phosphoribosylaminoimidazole carboxylase ade2 [Brettanomyces bruxellensis]QOU23099.1 phosphoribosylaminoimidazole carboxylase ade2 [Brettanomyces bruxellensis]
MDSKVVGILGGGQLGRMLVEAANRLNINTVVLEKGELAPAKQINAISEHIDGSFTNLDDIKKLAKKCDVLTVEIEHVNTDALKQVQKETGVEVHPSPETLEIIKDKFAQKEHLLKYNIPVAESVSVESTEPALLSVGEKLGYPFMLKSKTEAYDGRGNFVVKDKSHVKEALEFLNDRPLYAEKWAPFIKELAVMVVRSLDNKVYSYPTVETVQQNNICHIVYAPARVNDTVQEEAQVLARKAVASFTGAGIFGVEMFLLPGNKLLLNEIAPRPHNSGHYTIDACVTSQFEAHIRAITGLPMPKGFTCLSTPDTHAIMLNILGADKPNGEIELCKRALSIPNASVYLYGKSTRPGRKMGHINIVSESMDDCERRLAYIRGESEKTPEALGVQATKKPLVGVIMGSDSDLPVMADACRVLQSFGVPFEVTVISAHRTPHRMSSYAINATKRGLKCIIAGAGGAAHLPGMVAAMTPLPVIGVPVKGHILDGVDSLHSIVQMPRGVPVATVAINNSTNAALLAVRILGVYDSSYTTAMEQYQSDMEDGVLVKAKKLETIGFEEYLAQKK